MPDTPDTPDAPEKPDASTTLFDDLPESIQRSIDELGWKRPMPVQEKVIP